LAESLAFAARSSASAPPAPAVQARAPGGNNLDDSSDDDEDEEEEDDEENHNEEANEEQQNHYMGLWPVTEHYTSMFEKGHFPNLLQDILHALGTYYRPLYEPPRACYYITRIHVRVMDAGDRGFMTLSAHESLTSLHLRCFGQRRC
jgi:hypothetical protein